MRIVGSENCWSSVAVGLEVHTYTVATTPETTGKTWQSVKVPSDWTGTDGTTEPVWVCWLCHHWIASGLINEWLCSLGGSRAVYHSRFCLLLTRVQIRGEIAPSAFIILLHHFELTKSLLNRKLKVSTYFSSHPLKKIVVAMRLTNDCFS
jgi:hypothetical protein